MPTSLLRADDPAPVELIAPAAPAPVLLTCDHASRAVPAALGNLGLDDATLAQHIGWDIGAAAVTRALAPLLGAPAILSGYSRLVIDCNRDPDDPSSIPAASDGVTIPGNRDLIAAARAARREALFAPYHDAIGRWVEAKLAAGTVPALLSIHSFTPVMNGGARPWHVGILRDEDGRLPLPLLEALRAEPDLCVGDNQPYSAREPAGYTVRYHAERLGLPHVAIELRQDLIADAAGAAGWAARLGRLLAPLLAPADLYQRWMPAASGKEGVRPPQ
jgi:predicted N-formylglutamate amidohydrolase